MDKCIAIIKNGPRKGQKCGANKKVIDIIDGKEIPHCNRHKLKTNTDNVDELSKKLKEDLKIVEKNKHSIQDNGNSNDINIEETIDSQNILDKIDKQLDDLFGKYGL